MYDVLRLLHDFFNLDVLTLDYDLLADVTVLVLSWRADGGVEPIIVQCVERRIGIVGADPVGAFGTDQRARRTRAAR